MSQENVVRGVRIPVSLPSESAGQRRSLDERLFLRFPAVYRLFAESVLRLPPRSRLRRLMLARLIGRLIAAGNRQDFEPALIAFDRDIEYRPRADLISLDKEDVVVNGHGGLLQIYRKWIDAFGDLRYEPEEVVDFGSKLLVTVQLTGHGSGSGVPISGQTFQLFTLRRGLVVKQQDFPDRDDALEAAGLRE
jgi:SnoaL-like domain